MQNVHRRDQKEETVCSGSYHLCCWGWCQCWTCCCSIDFLWVLWMYKAGVSNTLQNHMEKRKSLHHWGVFFRLHTAQWLCSDTASSKITGISGQVTIRSGVRTWFINHVKIKSNVNQIFKSGKEVCIKSEGLPYNHPPSQSICPPLLWSEAAQLTDLCCTYPLAHACVTTVH